MLIFIAQGQGFGSRGSFWADFKLIEILGGAGDIYIYIYIYIYITRYVCPTTEMDHILTLVYMYVNKVPIAWAEVWYGSYRARSSIMAPGDF